MSPIAPAVEVPGNRVVKEQRRPDWARVTGNVPPEDFRAGVCAGGAPAANPVAGHSASPLQFQKRGLMFVRQATVEARARPGRCYSFRLPTSGTRPATSPSENRQPVSRLQLSVERWRPGPPSARPDHRASAAMTADVPTVSPIATSTHPMASARSAQSSPGRRYGSAANAMAGASRRETRKRWCRRLRLRDRKRGLRARFSRKPSAPPAGGP